MADARDSAPERAAVWLVPVVRGALALVPSAVITFSQDHSPELGLTVFGAWAVAAGVIVGALAARLVADRTARWIFVANGVLTAAAGLTALGLRDTVSAGVGGVGVFAYTVAVWAAVTGILELVAGLRGRGRVAAARDWVAAGGLTCLLALVYVLIPLDPVTAVGLLGAYFVVLGVLLLIGGFSLKWAASRPVGTGDAASGSERS
ncbi:hypothetical protein ACFQ58_02135 [Agromyces sp. NPDC056523]|uniref:hypothetical protein n=1 Tax=Agromyces sp. NPDC056523 TaxID=3345850 RepID=UPI003670002E